MDISVVIPSFNRRHTLKRALQSIIEQTSPVDEIIVVDDGSTDRSSELVASEFPGVIIIRQANLGVSAARNRGIAAAQCDWIALLDSDDSWLPQKIQQIRNTQQDEPGFVLYHSDEIWMRRGVRVNPMRKHGKSGGWIFEHCLPMCRISPSAAVIKKSTLQALGMFDETLPACEDYDLWLRLCHRYPVNYIDQALINKYGGHDDQLSQQYPVMDQFRIRSLHRLLSAEDLQAEYYLAAKSMLLKKLEILITGALKHQNQPLIDEFVPLRKIWRNNQQQAVLC